MPPINLLSRYQLAVAPGALAPGAEPVRDVLFPWFALARPTGQTGSSSQPLGQPFPALLDTGFDDTLIIPDRTLLRALGYIPKSRTGEKKRFLRNNGAVVAEGFLFDLWGCECDRGPCHAVAGASRLLARDFVVWVSTPATGAATEHPTLFGMRGLQWLEAVLSFDYRTGVCDLTAEGQSTAP